MCLQFFCIFYKIILATKAAKIILYKLQIFFLQCVQIIQTLRAL